MAAPIFHEDTPKTGTGSDVDADMPATRPEDHFFFAVISQNDDDHTYENPAATGWATLVDQQVNAGNGSAWGFAAWLIGGASEPSTYTFDQSASDTEPFTCSILRWSGIALADPIGAVSTLNEGAGTTATAPAITAESADSIILRVYFADTDHYTSAGFSGGTTRARSEQTGDSEVNIAVVEEASPGASTTTGTHTATLDASDDWLAYTFEVLGVAGGNAPTGGIYGPLYGPLSGPI